MIVKDAEGKVFEVIPGQALNSIRLRWVALTAKDMNTPYFKEWYDLVVVARIAP